jgi:CHAT domain-containing protein/Tfp pilus assembly protein PilF
MKRILLISAVVTLSACGSLSSRRLDQAFEAASLAMRRGELVEALNHADRGLASVPSTLQSDRAWRLRLLRAEILLAKPDLKNALAALEQPVPDDAALAALRARHRYLVARSEVVQGRLTDALQALDDVGRLAPDERDLQLDAEVLGGQVRLRLGRWTEAESRLTTAVEQASAAGDRYREVLALNNLGMGKVLRSRCDEALSWFERVLAFEDLDQMLVYLGAMTNAGGCYARLGQFDRAVALQERAVALHRRRGSATYHEQALGELGSTYFLQNDVARALPYFQQAFEIAEKSGNSEDAALWAGNLAAAYVNLGKWDEAERFNDEATRLNPPNRAARRIWYTLYAGHIAAGRRRFQDAKRLFDDALAHEDRQPRVRWAAHEGLAGVAIASGDRRAAAAHFEAALETIERTRSDLLKTDYKLSFLTELIRFYRSYVSMLVDEGSIERALEVADSSRGRVLADRHGVGAPARGRARAFVELAAKSNTALVSYWLAPTRSYAWIVDGRGVQLQALPPSAEIESLVRQHLAAIQNALADPFAANGAGDRLFQMLVGPVLPRLARDAHVVIVPDGALHALNFETLPVSGARRHYWIEDAEIQVAPALSHLALASAARPASPSLLLIGNPTTHDPQFPALRYASTEMANILGHFESDRTRSLQGDRASPAAYREAQPDRFSLVHFTAHAAANLESPLDSAVILAGPRDAFKLYARDVAELPLHADLVTVSACRSAGERAYSGEGLVGFAWAFLRAGARRVVAGLWDVDDRSTADLMDALYGRLAGGEPAPAALRHAKLAMLERGGPPAKPYYWGPFQTFTVSLETAAARGAPASPRPPRRSPA